MRYSLLAGGKRIRPALTLATAEALGHGLPLRSARRAARGRFRHRRGLRRRAVRPQPCGHGALARRGRARNIRAGLRGGGARAGDEASRRVLRRDRGTAADREVPGDGRALRLLYLGRLERRKGVQNLLRAVTGLASPDLQLTLVGGDTDTAPLGGSMRSSSSSWRPMTRASTFGGTVPRGQLGAVISATPRRGYPVPVGVLAEYGAGGHLPNRPVLATPTGGFCELIQ